MASMASVLTSTVIVIGMRFVSQAMPHMHNVDLALLLGLIAQTFHEIVPTFGGGAGRFWSFAVAVRELSALHRLLFALISLLAGCTPAGGDGVGSWGISLPAAIISHSSIFDSQTLQLVLRRGFVPLQAFIHGFVPLQTGHLPVSTGIDHDGIVLDAMLVAGTSLLLPLVHAAFHAFVHFAQAGVHLVRTSGRFVAPETVAQLAFIEIFQTLVPIRSGHTDNGERQKQ